MSHLCPAAMHLLGKILIGPSRKNKNQAFKAGDLAY
jgi:hypothetical protein